MKTDEQLRAERDRLRAKADEIDRQIAPCVDCGHGHAAHWSEVTPPFESGCGAAGCKCRGCRRRA